MQFIIFGLTIHFDFEVFGFIFFTCFVKVLEGTTAILTPARFGYLSFQSVAPVVYRQMLRQGGRICKLNLVIVGIDDIKRMSK
jgi:hypothetical protein